MLATIFVTACASNPIDVLDDGLHRRRASNCDWECYVARYNDVQKQIKRQFPMPGKWDPIAFTRSEDRARAFAESHYTGIGMKQGRDCECWGDADDGDWNNGFHAGKTAVKCGETGSSNEQLTTHQWMTPKKCNAKCDRLENCHQYTIVKDSNGNFHCWTCSCPDSGCEHTAFDDQDADFLKILGVHERRFRTFTKQEIGYAISDRDDSDSDGSEQGDDSDSDGSEQNDPNYLGKYEPARDRKEGEVCAGVYTRFGPAEPREGRQIAYFVRCEDGLECRFFDGRQNDNRPIARAKCQPHLPELLKNKGKKCWSWCGFSHWKNNNGDCTSFCGAGGACCRAGQSQSNCPKTGTKLGKDKSWSDHTCIYRKNYDDRKKWVINNYDELCSKMHCPISAQTQYGI